MTATECQIRDPKNPPLTIVDHNPPDPFTSPLQRYMETYCKKCQLQKSSCRLDDLMGVKRMQLCISLYNGDVKLRAQDLFTELGKTAPPQEPLAALEDLETEQ